MTFYQPLINLSERIKSLTKSMSSKKCNCTICGNYNPEFSNNCDLLNAIPKKPCSFFIMREDRTRIEREIIYNEKKSYSTNYIKDKELLDKKMKYWRNNPLLKELKNCKSCEYFEQCTGDFYTK